MMSNESLKNETAATEQDPATQTASEEQPTPETTQPEAVADSTPTPPAEETPPPPAAEPPAATPPPQPIAETSAPEPPPVVSSTEPPAPPTPAAPAEPTTSAPAEPTPSAPPQMAPVPPPLAASTPAPETAEATPSTPPPADPPAASPTTPPTTAPADPAARPAIRPGVDPSAAKPVPTLDAKAPPTNIPGVQEPAPVASPQAPPRAAVDIPRTLDLDTDMEAAINAAMAGDEQQSQAPPPPAPVAEGEEAPPEKPSEEELESGMKMPARIESIDGDNVFLDLGYRSPGLLSARQFEKGKDPNIGMLIEVVVDKVETENGLIHVNLPQARRRTGGNWDSVAAGQVVDCNVLKANKGGLEVSISNLRGFLPASHVDLQFVEDLAVYVGQKLTVKILEVNPAKRNLIVSRREFLKIERQDKEAELWSTVAEGQNYAGIVKTLKDYGAFVDIGGADGFLHIGEISWTRIRHPSDVLNVGQKVEVQVISVDAERKRIGLGMKQLVRNPWQNVGEDYPPGATVTGKVTRTTNFGAFVELEPGMEGLVHISELDYARVNRVADVLKEGQESQFKVLDVDPGRKRISLSLKALKEAPPELTPKSDEDLAPGAGEAYERKRSEPLRGGYEGTGKSSGSGLFGNPDDFTG